MTYCQSIIQIFRIIQMYPAELEIKDTTESKTSHSYLDLLLSIRRDGQLRTSLYDKHDDFNFNITNFPFLNSNFPSSPAYGVFISQLIRYAWACYSYECFILRAARLSCILSGTNMSGNVWNVTRRSGTWSYTVTPSIDQTFHLIVTLLPN